MEEAVVVVVHAAVAVVWWWCGCNGGVWWWLLVLPLPPSPRWMPLKSCVSNGAALPPLPQVDALEELCEQWRGRCVSCQPGAPAPAGCSVCRPAGRLSTHRVWHDAASYRGEGGERGGQKRVGGGSSALTGCGMMLLATEVRGGGGGGRGVCEGEGQRCACVRACVRDACWGGGVGGVGWLGVGWVVDDSGLAANVVGRVGGVGHKVCVACVIM